MPVGNIITGPDGLAERRENRSMNPLTAGDISHEDTRGPIMPPISHGPCFRARNHGVGEVSMLSVEAGGEIAAGLFLTNNLVSSTKYS